MDSRYPVSGMPPVFAGAIHWKATASSSWGIARRPRGRPGRCSCARCCEWKLLAETHFWQMWHQRLPGMARPPSLPHALAAECTTAPLWGSTNHITRRDLGCTRKKKSVPSSSSRKGCCSVLGPSVAREKSECGPSWPVWAQSSSQSARSTVLGCSASLWATAKINWPSRVESRQSSRVESRQQPWSKKTCRHDMPDGKSSASASLATLM
mmetsp:Transcript_31867/g.102925  ORF Transcript_31867/g.102925 Transcript_31867/m.102925 type:complete len:210 (+) Transcript_31867:1928-2557(+)